MNSSKILIVLVCFGCILFGCKKAVPENQGATLLYAENIKDIKKGEPLSLTFGDDDVTDNIVWSVVPSTNNVITQIANNVTIVFSAAGVYTVTATMGEVYATYTITVDNIEYTPDYGTKFTMTTPKFVNISENEPVVFSVHNSNASSIGWSLFTSIPYTIARDDIKKTATVIFNGSGSATISAIDGTNAERRTIWIGASTNTTQKYYDFMLGDKLQLTPSVEQTSSGKRLNITAKTNRKYHCSTDKILSFSVNNELAIDYSGVSISPQTCNVRSTATAVNNFKNIAIGTHPFEINFLNKTYTGTVTLDATGKYTFSWQDASVVSISPLEVY